MPENRNTDAENESDYLDAEDWRIAFEPYEGYPLSALTLGYHLAALKEYVKGPTMREGLATIDIAIDCLFEHSEFRSISCELFLTAIEGRMPVDKEELIRQLGIRI
jgi:hypothetical protein